MSMEMKACELADQQGGVVVVWKVQWMEVGSKPLQVSLRVKRRRGPSCCPWFSYSHKVATFTLQEAVGHPGNSFTSEPAALDLRLLENKQNVELVKICVQDSKRRKHVLRLKVDDFLGNLTDCSVSDAIEIALIRNGQELNLENVPNVPQKMCTKTLGRKTGLNESSLKTFVKIHGKDYTWDKSENDQHECEQHPDDDDVPAFDLADYTFEWGCVNEIYGHTKVILDTEPGNQCLCITGNIYTKESDTKDINVAAVDTQSLTGNPSESQNNSVTERVRKVVKVFVRHCSSPRLSFFIWKLVHVNIVLLVVLALLGWQSF